MMLCLGNLLLVSCINEGLETSFSLLPPGVEVGIAKENHEALHFLPDSSSVDIFSLSALYPQEFVLTNLVK